MDKNYYAMNYCNTKTISEKTMLKSFANDDDTITWYDDGKNIFIGPCDLKEKSVVIRIIKCIGKFDADAWCAGELEL